MHFLKCFLFLFTTFISKIEPTAQPQQEKLDTISAMSPPKMPKEGGTKELVGTPEAPKTPAPFPF